MGRKYRYGYLLDDLSQDEVRAELCYNPVTGEFHRHSTGRLAGSRNPENGNIQIRVQGRLYLAHRLAWLYMKGVWPPDEIDHDDGNRSNNRWKNLKCATHAENHQNEKLRIDNKTGVRGVNKRGSRWVVRIQVNKVRHLIGWYTVLEEARAAAIAAKREFHYFKPVQRTT